MFRHALSRLIQPNSVLVQCTRGTLPKLKYAVEKSGYLVAT